MKEGENEQKGFPVDTGVIKDFHGRCWLGIILKKAGGEGAWL